MFWYQFSSYSYSLVRTVTGRCSADIRAANFREVSSTALVDMDGASKDVCRLVNEEKLRCKDQSRHRGFQVLRVRRMLGVTVSPQVNFSLESFITKSASKGFVSSVFSHVRYQIAALRK